MDLLVVSPCCYARKITRKCRNWHVQVIGFLFVFVPSFSMSMMRVPIKNMLWLRSETDIPPRVLDPKLNEKEPQRHATNNHPNLSELELFCFATPVRKPQAFHHPKRIWRTNRKYKNWTQIAHNCAVAFFLQQLYKEPDSSSKTSLAKIITPVLPILTQFFIQQIFNMPLKIHPEKYNSYFC